VQTYKIYTIDKNGHIAAPAQVIECQDDYAAIEKAQQLRDGVPIELWNGTNFIVRLKSEN
jgi:hypothetical protein